MTIVERARKWVGGRYSKSRYQKNFLQVASANMAAQILPVLMAPVMTRLYSPHDYGILATFLAWLTFGVALAGLRVDWFVSSAKASRRALSYLRIGSLSVLGFTLALVMLLGLLPEWLKDYARGQQLLPFIWLLPVAVWLSAMSGMIVSWFVRQAKLAVVSLSRITQSIVGTFAGLLAGLFSLGAIGLMSSTMISLFAGLIVLIVKGKIPLNISSIDRLAIISTFKHAHRRIGIAGVTGFINAVGLYIPVLLIGIYYSPIELGWYAFATRLAVTPIQTITSAVAQSFWGEVTHAKGVRTESVRAKYKTTLVTMAKFSMLVLLGCMVAPLIVGPIFGREHWSHAGAVLLALAPYLVTQVVVSPLAPVVAIFGYERWLLVWDATRTTCVAAGFVVAPIAGFTFVSAILIFSLTMASFYLVLLVKMNAVVKGQ